MSVSDQDVHSQDYGDNVRSRQHSLTIHYEYSRQTALCTLKKASRVKSMLIFLSFANKLMHIFLLYIQLDALEVFIVLIDTP